jgi:hypothetical protein
VKACSVTPAVFSLLLPLPTAAFLHHQWRNEKPRLRSWKLEPNPTAIREGPTERKTALETTGSTIRRLRVVRDQYLSARANFDADMLHTR